MPRHHKSVVPTQAMAGELPLLAIVGRPNVGKSTLFNRLTKTRRSIVGDEPGITRDRIYGEFEWSGRSCRLVDTGGIVPNDAELIPSEIYRQAKVGIEEADAIVFVVDGRTELASPDYDLAKILLRGGKPVFLAVNKVEGDAMHAVAENFRRLGFKQMYPVSSEHGLGIGDLLDAVWETLSWPEVPPEVENADAVGEEEEENFEDDPVEDLASDPLSDPSEAPAGDPDEEDFDHLDPNPDLRRNREAGDLEQEYAEEARHLPTAEELKPLHRTHGEYEQQETSIAIIGRPNVGKSTLLNALTGTSRAIVSPIAGTTRDAVDEVIEYEGQKLRFVDTAGIRRKGKTHLMAEKLSVVMARRHLEAADVALLVIDAAEGVTANDATIGGYAHESGRSVMILINKWDLVTTHRADGKPPADREVYEQQVRRSLKYLDYAPIVFLSAVEETQQGKGNLARILRAVTNVAAERRKRVSTGQMNRFVEKIDFQRAPVPMAKRIRIFYMTQAAVAPPTFVLFTDRQIQLHFAFERFLENQIREAFGFEGTPIWFKVRARAGKGKAEGKRD